MILRAGGILLVEVGYGALAMTGIAERAVTDQPTVYRSAWDLGQSPRSLRNLLVYSSADVPETELQVGDAYVVVVAQGVSRSSDQKCSPARPLLTA